MYKNMTEILKENAVGNFYLKKFTITVNNVRAIMEGIEPGEYIALHGKNDIIMSNTPMEKRTNLEFCEKAHGDVLIGGLGIGLIILAIQNKEDVDSITVIEKEKDIIDLVKPQLPLNNKVKIINSDVYEWKPNDGEKYNCIYMDIWNFVNEDVYYNEMTPLVDKYDRYLVGKSDDENRFVKCWAEEEAKLGRRLY